MDLSLDLDRTGNMASKRNSRVYSDEVTHRDQKPVATSYRSRRNSRGSVKDDMMPVGKDAEEGQAQCSVSAVRDNPAASRSQNSVAAGKDFTASKASKNGDVLVAMPPVASVLGQLSEFPPAPLNGRPLNFGVVLPGVYRSSYPKAEAFAYLQGLKLKTLVTLVKKDDVDHELETFVSSNGIRQVVINMKGTKKETIPPNIMKAILTVVLDHQNYPLLLHCNHGKHRTGCVVGVIRKVSGWNMQKVLDEYRTYAEPKIRECDVEYISAFKAAALQADEDGLARFSKVQVRTFLRTLLFSTFVMVLWLVSGSQMSAAQDRLLL